MMKRVAKAMRGLRFFFFLATLLMINILWLVTACGRIVGYPAAFSFMAVHSSWVYEGTNFLRTAGN
jgi:hypothetical protein